MKLHGFTFCQGASINRLLRDDHEEGSVDGVGAFAQNAALTAALAAIVDKRRGILEGITRRRAAERLLRRQRPAVAGINVPDAAFAHGHERHLVYAELPKRIAKVQATAQQFRLVTGFIVQSDDPSLRQRAALRP